MSTNTRQRGANKDFLSQYDDLDENNTNTIETTPLVDEQQEQIIAQLKEKNDSSNYIYRALILFMIGFVLFLYLTPIPSYINGTHPENHLTLFHHGVHIQGTKDHLTYLPAFPIYMMFFGIQGYLLYLAGYELLALMGHYNVLRKLARHTTQTATFPFQPHPFGTAPNWIVPFLSDLRWSQGTKINLNQKTNYQPIQDTSKPVSQSLSSPRLLYLWALFGGSCPLPFLIFGAGNFSNAGWFAFTPALLGILLVLETSIERSERELLGLNGLKYNVKSA